MWKVLALVSWQIFQPKVSVSDFCPNLLGVDIYIIDSGVEGTHEQLLGRVSKGFSFVQDGRAADTDCNGHGEPSEYEHHTIRTRLFSSAFADKTLFLTIPSSLLLMVFTRDTRRRHCRWIHGRGSNQGQYHPSAGCRL
jgi:hypothetical protein